MPTSNPQSDAFPLAYNVALQAARDLTLPSNERARVIDLLVQVLLIWPKRWNESIEREVAELAQGALAWAEQASEGCPVSFERAVELSGDEPALFVVLVAAVRRAKTDAVRAQLEGWLAARSWDIHGKRALSTGSRK